MRFREVVVRCLVRVDDDACRVDRVAKAAGDAAMRAGASGAEVTVSE